MSDRRISEFSYGCAVIREAESLVSTTFRALGAPVLPSLRDEKGLGYDAHVPFVGYALFFQFKRSTFVSQRHPNSPTWDHVGAPHYRWEIDTDGHQHQALIDLEQQFRDGLRIGDVLYAAPQFHLPSQLDDAYLRSEVLNRSTLLAPHEFGTNCGVNRSVFAPRTGMEAIFSEPREPERLWTLSDLVDAASGHAADAERRTLQEIEESLRSALSTHLQRGVESDPSIPIARRIERLCAGLGGQVILALLDV